LLPARSPLPQHVQADPGHHGGQPAGQVVHFRGVSAVEPQPRFLHHVVGVAARAEHSVGQRFQPRALPIKLPGKPLPILHRVYLPAFVLVMDLTDRDDGT
jgi:hypothetical protein